MEKIGATIDKVISRLKQIKKENPQDRLKKYLTKEEFRHIKLTNVYRGIMTINVDSSARLYALSLKKQELIDKLGSKDIRLRLGEIE